MFRAIRRGASPPVRGRGGSSTGLSSQAGAGFSGGGAGGSTGAVSSSAACLGRALPHLDRQQPQALDVRPRLRPDALRVGSGRCLQLGGAALGGVHDRADALAARGRAGARLAQLLHGVRHGAQVIGHGLGVEAVPGTREVLALDRLSAQVHSRLSVAVSRGRSRRRWAASATS